MEIDDTPDQAPPDPAAALLDGSGRRARQRPSEVRCPGCREICPPGDRTKRGPSGGFGREIWDTCQRCGHVFTGERTV